MQDLADMKRAYMIDRLKVTRRMFFMSKGDIEAWVEECLNKLQLIEDEYWVRRKEMDMESSYGD